MDEILLRFYTLRGNREALEGNPASVPLRLEARVICFNSETTLGLFGVMNTRSVPEAREREQPRKQARRTCEIKLVNRD